MPLKLNEEEGLLGILNLMFNLVMLIFVGIAAYGIYVLTLTPMAVPPKTYDYQRQVVRTYSCTDEDQKIRAEWEVNCVGEDVTLSDMCRRYSAELFCEVSYD